MTTVENFLKFLPEVEKLVELSVKHGATPWESFNDVIKHTRGQKITSRMMTVTMLAQVSTVIRDQPEDERDFSRAFYSQRVQTMLRDVMESGNNVSGTVTICHHLLSWVMHGKHDYDVSEGLAVMLALTELRGVRCSDVRLPFRSFRIEVPEVLGFQIKNPDTGGTERLESVFVQEDRFDNATQPDAVTPGRSLRLMFQSTPYRNVREEANDSAQAFIALPMDEGDSVDDSVEKMRRRMSKQTDGFIDRHSAEFDNWISIWRWVLNVIMYATTPDAEAEVVRGNPDAESIWRRIQKLPKVSAKRDRLKAQLRGMDQKQRTRLGKSVRLTPALREMYEHHRSGENKNPLRVRTLVAGHFQRFAVGKGRTERVWKFREAFWRGPENAPIAEASRHKLEDE